MNLVLKRPIVFFDLETTGLNLSKDKIIEFCFIKLFPDGKREEYTQRVNPQMAISQEAQYITGIKLEDLQDCGVFKDFAKPVYDFLQDSDLAGYNLLRFDIPLLNEEFKRGGIEWKLADHLIIDMQRIFHQREKRDLSAALKFYTGEELVNAHAASADVEASIKILKGQLTMYDDLDNTVEKLADYCKDLRWVDRTGKIHWLDGEATLAFSKKKGTSLRSLAQSDRNMLKWIVSNDFPDDVKDIVNDALNGIFPQKTI